jgi:hypothetical protein
MATAVKKPAAKAAKRTAPTRRPAANTATKSAPKASSAQKSSAKAAKAIEPVRDAKPKKPKLVRDSFTIPKTEYTVLEALKARAAKAGSPAKKSELLRAGIKALAAMQDGAFLAALGAVPAIKTGRPAKA